MESYKRVCLADNLLSSAIQIIAYFRDQTTIPEEVEACIDFQSTYDLYLDEFILGINRRGETIDDNDDKS